MELVTLSKDYGNFYAPAYAVRIGRADLMRELVVAVSQVEVDLVLGAASRFSFTLNDCYSHKFHVFKTGRGQDLLPLLAFGAEVEICMGYGDAKSTPVAMSGVITEITTNFPEAGSPELSVAGYDHGFPLTIGKNSRTWTEARDSDAAHEITSFNRADRTEPGKRLGVSKETCRPQSLRALRRRTTKTALHKTKRQSRRRCPAHLRRRTAEFQTRSKPRRAGRAG
jgi:hypothetical protein